MNQADFSFIADALLAMVGQDHSAPFELDAFDRKRPTTARQKEALIRFASAKRPEDELLENECRTIFDKANLTEKQAEVLDLRLLGLSFEQIARCKGTSRQGSMKVFLQAIKKIGRVMRVYPYTGLSDVYRYEVRRGLRPGPLVK